MEKKQRGGVEQETKDEWQNRRKVKNFKEKLKKLRKLRKKKESITECGVTERAGRV